MKNNTPIGLKGKTTLLLGGLIFLLLAIMSLTSYLLSRHVAEKQVIELEQSKLSLLQYQIESTLDNHRRNLMSLHDVPPIQAILRARTNNGIDPNNGNTLKQWQDRLKIIFTAFMVNHPEYQQVRYIATNGQEMVRVESVDGNQVRVVPENELQNKSESLYVTDTLLLNDREVYYSDVTLNREYGEIQTPHTPVLRMATPVYNEKGIISGLLVINVATERMFSRVTSETSKIVRAIVNQDGYYIKHPQIEKTFGFDLGNDEKLQYDHPQLARLALRQDRYMEHDYRLEQLLGFQKIFFSPTDPERYWLLTLTIPEDLVFAEINSSLNRMLAISLLIGLISLFLIIWFTSRKLLKPVVNLATAARRLQEGDLGVRVNADKMRDEFATLSTAINAFAENQQLHTQELETRVASQTERLTAVIDNVVDGIITINVEGMIESLNSSAERIFGFQAKEVIGRNVSVLMPEPYRSEHDSYIKNLITTGNKKVIGIGREVTGRRKDGSVFPMELAVSQVLIEDEIHFVGITRDITERKRNEQMQKEFISMVSHELRTPLTSIRGALGLIMGKFNTDLPASVTAMLEIANNNSERLIHLINDILDIDKIEAGKMHFDNQVTDISTVISHSIESNHGYADNFNVNFIKGSGFDLAIAVYVDPLRIAQVMSNLLSNAAKYSPEHNSVVISIEKIDSYVKVSVHDQGKGIPQEFQSRIFTKFAQADSSDTRQKGGTGLGLNISKAIVESQGGNLDFTSSPQTGTTFSFTLPIYHPEPVNLVTTPVVSQQCRILMVDKSNDIALQLQQELSRIGCIIHHVETYSEAVELIRTHQFDAITVNLLHNYEDGIAVLRNISAIDHSQSIPVIAITSNSETMKSFVDLSSMNIHWIDSPLNPEQLSDSVCQALASQLANRRRILHVEDDKDLCKIVDTLLDDDYPIDHAISISHARELLRNNIYHLVILDIELPDGSGLDLLATINAITPRIPVIIFSAYDDSSTGINVEQVLVKSRTNNDQLVEAIQTAIAKYNQQVLAQTSKPDTLTS